MRYSLPAIAVFVALSGTAMAAEIDPGRECFDAIVSAQVLEQIPTDIDLTPDLFAWPWFIDLKIERVLQGNAPMGQQQEQQPLRHWQFSLPWRSALDDGISEDKEFSGAGDEGELMGLSSGPDALIEVD